MKTKIKELSGSRRAFEIEIPIEAITEKYEEVYSELQKNAAVAGFRVGKAPRYLIEANYKGKASEEVRKRLIAHHFSKAIEEAKLGFIGLPMISEVVFEDDKPLTFKVEVNVKPEIKLKTYKGLNVKKGKVLVPSEEVDKVVEELQDRHAHLKDVEGRLARENDWCLCDVEISVDGKPGEKSEGVWFPLNPKSTKPEFLSQLIGANCGDTKTVKTTLPANYPRKDQAEKEATFIITVNQIKEKIAPLIDDEFAKEAGGFKSLLELRGNIREELTKAKEQEINYKVEEDIINQLVKSTNFEAPAAMVNNETSRILEDMRSRLQYMGYKKEDMEAQEHNMKEKMGEEAIKRVKGFLLLDKIVQVEGISATEADLKNRLELLAPRLKKSVEETKNYLEEKGLLEDVRVDIVQDKAMAFLVANAKIEEA